MSKHSAGILLFKVVDRTPLVMLVHPGGPFWRNKDAGAWTIPKGECSDSEELQTTALREFAEETGTHLPDPELVPLGQVKQKGGKVVTAWAVAGVRTLGGLFSGALLAGPRPLRVPAA